MASEDIRTTSIDEAEAVIAAHGKFKARSHNTYLNTHVRELEKRKDENFDVVLLGDSMLERLKDIGNSCTSTKTGQMPSTFNAGVGGDRIENVLYRLGLGMMTKLSGKGVKLWVVMIGTNNMKKALRPEEVESYRLLLQSLLKMSPTSKILACEIFKRKDIEDSYVDESNLMLQGVIRIMNEDLGEETIFWQDAPMSITKESLVDHVHLSKEAYAAWDDVLYPRIQALL